MGCQDSRLFEKDDFTTAAQRNLIFFIGFGLYVP